MPETKGGKIEEVDETSQVPQGDTTQESSQGPSTVSVGESLPSGTSPVPMPTPPPGEVESQSGCRSPLVVEAAEGSPPEVQEAAGAGGSSNVPVEQQNYQPRFLLYEVVEESKDTDRLMVPPPAKLPRSPESSRDGTENHNQALPGGTAPSSPTGAPNWASIEVPGTSWEVLEPSSESSWDFLVETSPGTSQDPLEPSPGTSTDLFASCLLSGSNPSLSYLLDVHFNATSNYPEDANRISAPFLPTIGSGVRRCFFDDLLTPASLEPLSLQNPQSLSLPTTPELRSSGASVSPRRSPIPGTSWGTAKERIAKFPTPESLAVNLAQHFFQKFKVALQRERLDYMSKAPFGVSVDLWKQAMFAATVDVLATTNHQIWTHFYRFDQLMCTAKWLTGASVHIDLEEVTYTRFVELQKNFFPQHKLMEVEESDDDSEEADEKQPTVRYPICPANFVFCSPRWEMLTIQLIEMIYPNNEAKLQAVYRRLQNLYLAEPKNS